MYRSYLHFRRHAAPYSVDASMFCSPYLAVDLALEELASVSLSVWPLVRASRYRASMVVCDGICPDEVVL